MHAVRGVRLQADRFLTEMEPIRPKPDATYLVGPHRNLATSRPGAERLQRVLQSGGIVSLDNVVANHGDRNRSPPAGKELIVRAIVLVHVFDDKRNRFA